MKKVRLSTVLIGLDLSSADDTILQYVSDWNKILSFEKIYLIHISEDFLKEELPEHLIQEPADEEIESLLAEKAKKYFQDKDPLIFEAHEGDPFDKLLRVSKIKEPDLLVFGVKNKAEGSGLTPQKLLRHSSGSVLLIPEGSVFSNSKLVCPIDFSEHSLLAASVSLDIAQDEEEVFFLHLSRSHFSYLKSAESSREAIDHLEKKAARDSLRFFEQVGLNKPQFINIQEGTESSHHILSNFCLQKKCDLMVLGSKGQTASVSSLIGSFAEKVAMSQLEVPILIMRKKGENLDLLKWVTEMTEH